MSLECIAYAKLKSPVVPFVTPYSVTLSCRYLQMSAQARIMGFTAGYPEFLDVTMEHPDFIYSVRE